MFMNLDPAHLFHFLSHPLVMTNLLTFFLTLICFLCDVFRFTFDAMHAVTGAYAKPIFVEKLGASPVRC